MRSLITILLPAYNAEAYLAEAIDSLLAQTFTDFELLIINDGSTDGTEDVILSYSDPRIRCIKNEQNIRLIATLNKGIELAQGKYIARMDADDISLPHRLAQQVSYMEAHPEVGLCGSFLEAFDDQSYSQVVGYQTEHEAIHFRLFFDTHFPHPTAMIRTSVLRDHHLRFDPAYIHAEDFALWNQMAEVCKIYILPEILLKKRNHAEQVSVKYLDIQHQVSAQIRKELLALLGVELGENELQLYEGFLLGKIPPDYVSVKRLLGALSAIIEANRLSQKYASDYFDAFF